MTDNQLNDLAMQMVNSMKTMDDFKQIQKLMLQQFINNSLEAEMQEHLGYSMVCWSCFHNLSGSAICAIFICPIL